MGDEASELSFIDSNVWLYAFVEAGDAAKRSTATALIQRVAAVVSTQVINEVCVNLLKKTAFSEADVRGLVDSYFMKYSVAVPNHATMTSASLLRERNSFSYWDSLVVAAAIEADCRTLYSEDMQHGMLVNGNLRIVNPFTVQADDSEST